MTTRTILIFSPGSPLRLRGAEQALLATSRGLAARGWGVSIVTQEDHPAGEREELLAPGVRCYFGRKEPDAGTWITALSPDVVGGLLGWIRRPLATARARGVATVGFSHLDGCLPEAARDPGAFSLVVANTEQALRGAPRFRRSLLLHPPLGDPARWRGDPTERPRRPVRIGAINLADGKGGRVFHALAERIGDQGGTVAWVGVRGGYGAQATKGELPGVVYRPPAERVAEVYEDLDVLLLPSLVETFGMVAREALASGVAVLASDLPGVREAVGDCGGALLLPPAQTDRWEEELRDVLAGGRLAELLAAAPTAALRWAEEEEAGLDALAAALEQAAKEDTGRPRSSGTSEAGMVATNPRTERRAEARRRQRAFEQAQARARELRGEAAAPAPDEEPLRIAAEVLAMLRPSPSSAPGRVVFVARRLFPAAMGGEQSILRQLRMLAARGAEVVAIYAEHEAPPCEVDEAGVRYVYAPHASAQRLAAVARQLLPGLLIAHDRWVWEACAGLPSPKVAEVRYWTGLLVEPRDADSGGVPVPGAAAALARYDGVATNSTYAADLLVSLGIPRERIAPVRPPVHASTLETEGPRVELRGPRPTLIVGKWKMRPDVVSALEAAGPVEVLAYDRPTGAPRLDPGAMAQAYRRAAVVAHPTFLCESFCKAALEAMAHGRPFVYPRSGNLPRLVGANAGIALAADATPRQWVAAVAQARDEATRRGAAGRQRAAWIQEYSDTGEELADALQAVAAGRPPGRLPTVLVPDYPGVWTASQHLAAVAGVELAKEEPASWDVLLLGSYSARWLKALPSWRRRGRKVAQWWHSDLAQSDFSDEPRWLLEVLQAHARGELAAICATAESLARVLEARGASAHWLPDVVDLAGALRPSRIYAPGARPSVSLFAGASARKNHATSLGAAALAGAVVHAFPRLRRERRLADLVRALGVELVEHPIPFEQKAPVVDLLAAQTCTLHPSHGETFCYAVAESILAGTPAIGSGCVPVLQGVEGDEGLSVLEDTGDCVELAHRIALFHANPELRARVARAQLRRLEELNFRNTLIARRTLRRLAR